MDACAGQPTFSALAFVPSPRTLDRYCDVKELSSWVVAQAASDGLKTYIGQQFSALLIHDGFADAIQDCTRGDQARADLLFERLENIVKVCKSD